MLSSSSRSVAFVPLRLNGGSHAATRESAALIKEAGGVEGVMKMTGLFYEKVFVDATLDLLIRDRTDPHASRFSTYICEKMGYGSPWTEERKTRKGCPFSVPGRGTMTVHDRTSAHVSAWNSPKRPAQDMGKRFSLGDCRVWMRLHFWAMRDSGLMESAPGFCSYYVRWVGHFVRVYESTAPAFARDSLRWSESAENIATYKANGNRMNDVLGISLSEACRQVPRSEVEDREWPYNTSD